MKKKSNFKIYFDKFKKLWNDKRYRSIIVLLLYFVFFAIIFIFLDLNSNSIDDKRHENTLLYKDYQIYEFSMDIVINGSIYNLKGKRYQDRYEFMDGDQVFNMNAAQIMTSNLDKNIINSFNYTPELIDNLVYNATLVSEKKIIADNSIIEEYALNLDKYLETLDINPINYEGLDPIQIIVSKADDKVTQIQLDLSSFYKNIEESYQSYQIIINYTNINNVLKF